MIVEIACRIAVPLMVVAILLNLWRLARGPDAVDRILALDTMTVNAIALILLTGILEGRSLLFEGALLLAMVGFVGTVVVREAPSWREAVQLVRGGG